VFYSLEKLEQRDIETAFKKIETWISKNKILKGRGEISLFPLKISPSYMFKDNKLFKLKTVDSRLKVNGLTFITKNNKVQSIKIMNGFHPNMNPDTKEFCIDETLKNKQFDIQYLFTIISLMETWNLNNCYRKPNPKYYNLKEIPKIGGITAHELNNPI